MSLQSVTNYSVHNSQKGSCKIINSGLYVRLVMPGVMSSSHHFSQILGFFEYATENKVIQLSCSFRRGPSTLSLDRFATLRDGAWADDS